MTTDSGNGERFESPRELLQWYVAQHETAHGRSTVPCADRLRKGMPPSTRLRAKQLATHMLAPAARRDARRLLVDGRRQLHLGCGWNHLEGWINVDLVGCGADVVWDIRRRLPFPEGSVEAVFLEHVLEHMPYSQCLAVLENARRVLATGGVLRVGVPDAGMAARIYAETTDRIQSWRRGQGTPMLALRVVFQQHGHVSAWDGSTLCLVLEAAGFPDAQVMRGGESRIDPPPDSADRVDGTVYAEALRQAD
jgi:predicted SAM-dependent methyltransferase